MSERPSGRRGGEGVRSLTADAIAALVSGTLRGAGGVTVHAVAPLDRAGPDEVSFYAHRRYADRFAGSNAGVVLVAPELADEERGPACRIVVPEPHEALLRVLPELYDEPDVEPGVHSTAVIGRGVPTSRSTVTFG